MKMMNKNRIRNLSCVVLASFLVLPAHAVNDNWVGPKLLPIEFAASDKVKLIRGNTLPADIDRRLSLGIIQSSLPAKRELYVSLEPVLSPAAAPKGWKTALGMVLIAIGEWLVMSDKPQAVVYGGDSGGNAGHNNQVFVYLGNLSGVKPSRGETLATYSDRAAGIVLEKAEAKMQKAGGIGSQGQALVKTDNQDAFIARLVQKSTLKGDNLTDVQYLSRLSVYDDRRGGGCIPVWKWIKQKAPRLTIVSDGELAAGVMDQSGIKMGQGMRASWAYALSGSINDGAAPSYLENKMRQAIAISLVNGTY